MKINLLKTTGLLTAGLALCFAVSSPPARAEIEPEMVEKLLATNEGTASDYFGYSVSVSGDIAVIGAYGDDDNGSDSGSAYVFTRTDIGWTQAAKLTADDGGPYDWFGKSVFVSGDIAVIGADGDDDNGSNSGSAYVFTRTDTGWTQAAKLMADDGAAFDFFGSSVSVSGDIAVIGAYCDDDNGTLSGSAYVFTRTDTGWTQAAKLLPDDGDVHDYFGRSVSVSGDTAVIGADCDDDNDTNSGSAYVFTRTGTGWTQTAKLTAGDGAAADYFGYSVSVSGDIVVIGAYGDDDNRSYSGSAYVFTRTGTGWTQTAKLTAGDGAPGDCFGRSVSVSGNIAMIGAHGDDDNGFGSGSAYVFTCTDTEWTQAAKLTANDGAIDDWFGKSVSVSGDIALIGADGDDDNGSLFGSAYVFNLGETDFDRVSMAPIYLLLR